jgi:hypothetical protein
MSASGIMGGCAKSAGTCKSGGVVLVGGLTPISAP